MPLVAGHPLWVCFKVFSYIKPTKKHSFGVFRYIKPSKKHGTFGCLARGSIFFLCGREWLVAFIHGLMVFLDGVGVFLHNRLLFFLWGGVFSWWS